MSPCSSTAARIRRSTRLWSTTSIQVMRFPAISPRPRTHRFRLLFSDRNRGQYLEAGLIPEIKGIVQLRVCVELLLRQLERRNKSPIHRLSRVNRRVQRRYGRVVRHWDVWIGDKNS